MSIIDLGSCDCTAYGCCRSRSASFGACGFSNGDGRLYRSFFQAYCGEVEPDVGCECMLSNGVQQTYTSDCVYSSEEGERCYPAPDDDGNPRPFRCDAYCYIYSETPAETRYSNPWSFGEIASKVDARMASCGWDSIPWGGFGDASGGSCVYGEGCDYVTSYYYTDNATWASKGEAQFVASGNPVCIYFWPQDSVDGDPPSSTTTIHPTAGSTVTITAPAAPGYTRVGPCPP